MRSDDAVRSMMVSPSRGRGALSWVLDAQEARAWQIANGIVGWLEKALDDKPEKRLSSRLKGDAQP